MARIKSKCGKRLNVGTQLLALPLTAPGEDHLSWCVNAYENLRGTQNIPPLDEDEQTGIPLSDVVHADGSTFVLEKELLVNTQNEKTEEQKEKKVVEKATRKKVVSELRPTDKNDPPPPKEADYPDFDKYKQANEEYLKNALATPVRERTKNQQQWLAQRERNRQESWAMEYGNWM
ncbi:unnamed protein product [Amoebophrya sp. A120]|nr:unnamed protein product [Amoebophrya sp. A120]|eukprot:GSA120T00009805001.1